MQSFLKYPGGKWRIANWIISFFPEHRSYLEPFFGSGAILFNKPRSSIETVNDLDGNVVNLFDWIRKDPERLAHEIYYTPYARQIYDRAYEVDRENSLEGAVNFFIRCNMGRGFRTNGERVGWKNDVQGRERAYAASDWCSLPERIMEVAERLRGVQIECRPAIELIERFNFSNVLLYLDPPYLGETRHGRQYRREMLDKRSHEELLLAAKAHKGPVLISGYESGLYNDILCDWHKEYTMTYSQAQSRKKEVLWMNFFPEKQMELFDLQGMKGEENG
jgi:DNA adenine methylase